MTNFFIPGIFLAIIFVISVVFLLIVFLKKEKLIFWQALNYKLLLISLPKNVMSEGQNKETIKMESIIASFDQFLGSLSYYKHPLVFEMAVPTDTEEIRFYVSAPKKDIDSIEKNISGFFPLANVEVVKDYTIFEPQGIVGGLTVKLNNHYSLPLKTYKDFASDSLSVITNAFSKLAPQNEGACLQIVFTPTSKSLVKSIEQIKKGLREGKSFKELTMSQFKSEFSKNWKQITKKDSSEEKDKEEKVKYIDESLIKLIEEKISRPLFDVNIRLFASANTKERTEEILLSLESALMQFSAPNANSLTFQKIKNKKALNDFVYNFSFRLFKPANKIVLNSTELTGFYHFPHAFLETPKIRWFKARSAPAPMNLPQEGIILGINSFRGEDKEVKILDEDRRRHIYVVGQTGTGKTSLMNRMFVQDMELGKGACFIDPHGDIAEDLIGLVPHNRADDLIYFNPGDMENSIGLNMLEYDSRYPFQKSFITNELLEIMDKLYDLKSVGGPIFEQYFRNAILLLLDDELENHTLNDVPRILINPDFRKSLLERTPNSMVREFWEKEAEKAGGDLSLANVAPYINSKLNPFLANDLVRPIISQKKSTINFRQIMDERKILIVNLSKGLLGDINSYLLGMLIVGKLTMAAFSRVDLPEDERKDFYLYIDEFQNVTTNTVATIFSEARKYRLSLVVAHQYIQQLKEDIQKSVFGNVATMISFRLGNAEEAETLGKQFAPIFGAYDLLNLDNFNAYIKLAIKGQTSQAFNFKTIKSFASDRNWAEKLKTLSALKYTRPRKEIEEEIKLSYEF